MIKTHDRVDEVSELLARSPRSAVVTYGECVVFHLIGGNIVIGQGFLQTQSQVKHACLMGSQTGILMSLSPKSPENDPFVDDIVLERSAVLFSRRPTWPEQDQYERALIASGRVKFP